MDRITGAQVPAASFATTAASVVSKTYSIAPAHRLLAKETGITGLSMRVTRQAIWKSVARGGVDFLRREV